MIGRICERWLHGNNSMATQRELALTGRTAVVFCEHSDGCPFTGQRCSMALLRGQGETRASTVLLTLRPFGAKGEQQHASKPSLHFPKRYRDPKAPTKDAVTDL